MAGFTILCNNSCVQKEQNYVLKYSRIRNWYKRRLLTEYYGDKVKIPSQSKYDSTTHQRARQKAIEVRPLEPAITYKSLPQASRWLTGFPGGVPLDERTSAAVRGTFFGRKFPRLCSQKCPPFMFDIVWIYCLLIFPKISRKSWLTVFNRRGVGRQIAQEYRSDYWFVIC